jgi:hypothetical protein
MSFFYLRLVYTQTYFHYNLFYNGLSIQKIRSLLLFFQSSVFDTALTGKAHSKPPIQYPPQVLAHPLPILVF